MKKLLIVSNPRSGRRRKENAYELLKHRISPHHYSCEPTTLSEILQQKADALRAYTAIVIIGGDGTIRAVTEHLQRCELDTPIAILPRGSANVIAKTLRIPHAISKATTLIQQGKTTRVDIARLDSGEYFVAAFSMGYLSSRIADTTVRLKQRLGFFGYILSFIKEIHLPLHHFSITVNGHSQKASGHSLFIVNTGNVFGLGTGRARDYNDGIYELVVTQNRTLLSLAGLIFDFYFRKKKPKYFFLQEGSKFHVTSNTALTLQIDGEILTPRNNATITVMREKQQFMIP